MNIQDFLLARVDQDEANLLAGHGVSPGAGHPDVQRPYDFEHLRSVIHLHNSRSVTAPDGGEVTQCGFCVDDTSQPCEALKAMAQPYNGHPDYDTAWDIVITDSV